MRFTSRLLLAVATGCTNYVGAHGPDPDPDAPARPDVPDGASIDVAPDGPLALDTTPGTYRGQCDGSGGVAIDFTHFVSFSDTDQLVRVFSRGANTAPFRTLELSAALGMATTDKADLEDAARVGDRIYVLGSHGRKNDGTLDLHRYRFAALDIVGASLTAAGATSGMLRDMLEANNWSTPDANVIIALTNASQLGSQQIGNLAPKIAGTNIEGLANAPLPGVPNRLVVGFRNPRPNNRAIVVSMMNADAMVTGAVARFGEASELDLGGLGIRAMQWSDALGAVLMIAGPHDDATSPFRLYKWSGAPGDAPELVMDLAPPPNTKPEAIVTYPGTKDIQLLLDSDDVPTASTTCDNASTSDRSFRDMVLHLD